MLLTLALALAQEPATAPEPEPATRSWDDFPVLVWRQRYAGRPLPEELVLPFGGANVERDDPAEWARERGLTYYVGHAPGRNALHLDGGEAWDARVTRWIEERDEALLVREPCLTDPATRRELFAQLDRTLAARDGDHGLGVSLGDEVDLTPGGNPLDLCRSETCEAAWRTWAAERGWPARAPTTDAVRVALGEDDFSLLGAWLARRRFHREVLHGLLGELADRVRRSSPGTPVGVLGIAGPTAFGGVDPLALHAFLDFAEVYPVVEQRERLAVARSNTFGPPRPRLFATVFLNEETPDGAAWQAWEHWMRGGDGLVVWSDAYLEDSAAHRERLARAVADIRRVAGRATGAPAPEGVALVHDIDSVAASWLRDALLDGPTWPRRLAGYQRRQGTRELTARAWLRLLEDGGLTPGVVRLQDVVAGTSTRFAVLVLPRLLVLGDADLARLDRHLAEGGVLVIDGELGWVDERGRRRQEDALERLRSVAPERVLEAPDWIREELERRTAATGPVDRTAGFLARVLAAAGVERGEAVRFQVDDARAGLARVPLLQTRRPVLLPDLERRAELVAFLPNLDTTSERTRHLGPVHVAVLSQPGVEVTWLHPTGVEGSSTTLAAGDAGVVLVEWPGD